MSSGEGGVSIRLSSTRECVVLSQLLMMMLGTLPMKTKQISYKWHYYRKN